MKTFFTLFTALIAVTLLAQENKTDQRINRSAEKFSDDVVIHSTPDINQERVKLSVAFNGWLYAAYSTIDSANNAGGITIVKSIDNGLSWQVFDSYMPTGIRYPAFDILVAGTDTSALKLYLIGVNKNVSTASHTIFLDVYNATNGNYIGSPYNRSTGTNRVYDIAIASDYTLPAVGASPYSVAFLYSRYSSSNDSVNYVLSVDGGVSFSHMSNVAITGAFFNKISLAYGRSNSGSNGRYFAAWERKSSSLSRNGNIYVARNTSNIDGGWTTPKCLDSLSSAMIGLCSNPSIAASIGDIDNDSAGVTAIVTLQRDYNGDASDYDLLGFYNKRAHFTDFWYRFDVDNSSTNAMQPNISYDKNYNNFLLTYYDSTNQKLPYVVNGFNLTTPNSWVVINAQYNDNTNLKSPYPVVEINPVSTKTAHAWIAKGTGTKGVAMFDAEYNMTGVSEIASDEYSSVYPNPARDEFSISFGFLSSPEAVINIYDVNGKVVESRMASTSRGGNFVEKFDVRSWENGMYLISVQSGNSTLQERIVVNH